MRIFTLEQNEPLHFIVCGNLRSNNEFLHMDRCFDDNVLIFVEKGTLYINSNNKSYSIKENQFILLKAGERHFGNKKSEGELSYYWIHFSTKTPIKISEESKFENQNYYFGETGNLLQSTKLIMLFHQLMDYSLEDEFYNKKILDYLCSVILMELSNQYLLQKESKSTVNPIIFNICNWIKQNYNHQFTISDISKFNGYQIEYISQLFKKEMNISILQYTNKIRIESAKKLLQNFSIKETAYSCGFEDEKYFMKVFKKSEGITPSQYKNSFYKKNIN